MPRAARRGSATIRLTPEETLLFLTCRGRLTEDEDGAVRRLVGAGPDWPYVLWRSEAYRTTPLIHHHLARLDLLEQVPEDARAYLECWASLSALRTSALYAELPRVLDALEQADIECFLLKGAAVAPLLYPDPLARAMLDIDVMVHPRDVMLARRVIRRLGYRHGIWDPETNLFTEVEHIPRHLELHHELPAFVRLTSELSPIAPQFILETWRVQHLKLHVRPDGVVSFPLFVDLHYNLSVGFDIDDVWRGMRTEDLLGRPTGVQSSTGMLWFLAARLYNEAFQYNTLKLTMFGDVHAILCSRTEDIDWDEVIFVAAKYGMGPALFYVLGQMDRLTDATVPPKVLARLAPEQSGLPAANDWGDIMPKLFSRALLHDVILA